MTGIQIVLVAAAFLWLSRFLSRMRSRGAVRAAAVAIATSATALVLFPDLSVRLAHLVGVARGVDVAIYLAFVALGFLWLHLAGRMNDLEVKLGELVRALALREAAPPGSPASERDTNSPSGSPTE